MLPSKKGRLTGYRLRGPPTETMDEEEGRSQGGDNLRRLVRNEVISLKANLKNGQDRPSGN